MKLVSLPSSFPLVETTVYSDDRRRSQTTRRARQSAIDQQRVKGRGMPYTDDRAAPRRPKQHTSIIESDFHKHLRVSSEGDSMLQLGPRGFNEREQRAARSLR